MKDWRIVKPKTAFTQKDILVAFGCVLFVLANLGAIGPGGRRRAKEALCLSNLRQWGHCYKMFADDNQGRLPSGFVTPLWPYYRNLRLLLCPAATKKGTVPHAPGTWGQLRGGKFEAWFDPVDPSDPDDNLFPDGIQRDVIGSYGMNGHVGEPAATNTSRETSWVTPYVKGAANGPVLLDGAGGAVPLHWDEPPEWDGQIYYGYSKVPGAGPPNVNEMRNFCINRHNGGVNVLFLDFSARKIGLKGLWELNFKRKNWFTNPHGFPEPYPPWQFHDPTHWMYNFKNYK